jgi:hypothetical protein
MPGCKEVGRRLCRVFILQGGRFPSTHSGGISTLIPREQLYGPHTAALYTRRAALKTLSSIAHHFHSPRYDDLPFKLQPGGPGYELTYASAAVLPYLISLSSPSASGLIDSEELLRAKSKAELRTALEHTSALFEAHERTLMEPLLSFLKSEKMYARGVRIVGLETCDGRAPTVSFVVVDTPGGRKGVKSREIVEKVDEIRTVSSVPLGILFRGGN